MTPRGFLSQVSAFLNEFSVDDAENMEIVRSLVDIGSSGCDRCANATHIEAETVYFIVELIEQTARTHPLLFWLDDAQWLDPSSAELLLESFPAIPASDSRAADFATPGPPPPEPQTSERWQQGRQECGLASWFPARSRFRPGLARAVEAADGIPSSSSS
jgi:hypothetical protein